jgi:Domain of unknown function (DUF4157)/Bacterial toxin 4
MRVQRAMAVSRPGDSAEREAEATARRVVSMPGPALRGGGGGRAASGIHRAPMAQRPRAAAPDPAPGPGPETEAAIRAELTGGERLSADVAEFMQPRFRADFSGVRIHTGPRAAALANRLGARAFTYGRHVFFNSGQFDPNSPRGMELIAHELTHTIQQSEAVQREVDPAPTVMARNPVMVQRGLISEVLDWIADKANYIPGYRLLTIILGVNPINMSRVERSGANILRAIVEFLPGGGLIVEALDRYGVFDRAGSWIEQQFATLGMVGSMFRDALMRFLDSLGFSDLFSPGDVWDRAKRIFTEPVDRLISFGKGLVTGILRFIREAILKPLAALAEGTRGYDLLKAVLGEDPVTGEPVPRNADTLIGGFMKLIGQEEIWANIKKANAIDRAWKWFQTALGGLMALVRSIPTRFMDTLRSLEIMDLVLPFRAFAKVGRAFASFLGDFISWAGGTVLDLLQIIIEVVAPSIVPYLRKAGAAFRTIIKDPIRFVRTLVRAAMQGFRQFKDRFLSHLQNSLIGWLTGAMAGVGLYIPKGLSLLELLKFALSVMGLTYPNVRAKLVKATNETVVKALETGFDIVVTLVKEGPVAAWQKILESLNNLKQMVIDQVMEFVQSQIVTAAVTKLLMMLNPAGAFIQAIIAIYNTIMFFVERLKQIAQVAASFIDSIAAIAAGAIAPAADRVEKTMAGLLTLVISFLARFAGLGKVSDAVIKLIDKVRKPVDTALDRVVAWIVEQARKLGRFIAQAGVPHDPAERLRLAGEAAIAAAQRLRGRVTTSILNGVLGAIRVRYGLTRLEPYQEQGQWFARGTINPTYTWRLPVPGETAGRGGVAHVGEAGVTPAGIRDVVIRGQLLPPMLRVTAPNYNASMPSAATLPSPHRHFVRGYEWAHLWGPGFGDEARAGLMLASGHVNRGLQSRGRVWGIEGYLRRLTEGVRSRGGDVYLQANAVSFSDPPPGVPGPIGQPVLRRVTYTVLVHEGVPPHREHRGSATIRCNAPLPNGTGGRGEPDTGSLQAVVESIPYV